MSLSQMGFKWGTDSSTPAMAGLGAQGAEMSWWRGRGEAGWANLITVSWGHTASSAHPLVSCSTQQIPDCLFLFLRRKNTR